MVRARHAPYLFRKSQALYEAISAIFFNFGVGMIPKRPCFPGFRVGTEHCLESALVRYL